MRELIRHILKESSSKIRLLKVIEDEGVFNAAELVGSMDNLRKILKDEPEVANLLDSLKGKLDLLGHFKNDIIEFPFEFEVVGIAENIHKTNSWPIINLIYDDSKLNESDKKLLEQFIYSSIADLNIGKLDIKPEVRDMYKDESYVSIDFVNGKNWESLDHDIEYDYNDIRNLHREYYIKNYMNESKILQENEEDPTQKILNFLRRRYKVEQRNLGDEQDPIIYKTIFFDVNGETYTISTFQNKQEQRMTIIKMLIEHDVIEPFNFYERHLDPYAQNVVRAVKTFLNQVMGDKFNINESEKKKTLEKPIKYFYKNFLHEKPIEYKGIILQPTYHEEYDVITWNIENPEDYSFNGELIKEVVVDEFRDFCSLVNLDFYGLYKKINVIKNMPNGRCYLNKNDENFIETTLKNKKYLKFDANKSQYMLNFEFVRYEININSDIIEITTKGYFEGVKINEDGKENHVDDRFIYEMTDYEHDDFKEWLFDGFYSEVLNHLKENPRFYDPRIDMFDPDIRPLRRGD